MDDLMGKLQEILSSEEGQAKLKEVASMLSGAEGGGLPDLSALSGLFGGKNNSEDNSTASDTQADGNASEDGGMDMSMLLKLMSAFSSSGESDKNAQLLQALKPHLRDENRHKVDEALKILKLIALLPLIKESGLFGGDLF